MGKKVRRKTWGNKRIGKVSVFDDGSEKHRRARGLLKVTDREGSR